MITPLACLLLVPQQSDPDLLSASERRLPHLGITVRDERRLDRTLGTIVRRTVDAQGREVDGDALRMEEARRRDERSGRISPELAEQLLLGKELRVVFWLRLPAQRPDLRGLIDQAMARGTAPEDARREALAAARTSVQPVTAAFVRVLAGQGHKPVYVDELVPIVFVDLRPEQVAALAAREEVDQAYFSAPAWYPENDQAEGTARTDAVHRRGVNGAGVKVMVNDVGNLVANGVNPYLPPVVTRVAGSATAHATAVAGMIASRHATYHGAAPGVPQIFDGPGYGDTGAPPNWSWAMTQGVSFGNCSWWNGLKGRIAFLDRYFDYIIRNFAMMLFKSAGNQGTSDGLITTPGCGYNMIASGCFNDRNTLDWNDDGMSSFSSWVNPVEGHDKPEVSAPGDVITSTSTSSPWTSAQGSGTSYASPVSCGIAALMAQTRAELLARPEAIKALLMAGAWHNIEGAARLSDRDGAGGVDGAASQQAAADVQYQHGALTAASFNASGQYVTTVPLVAGDETRLIALWFSEADSAYATDTLKMDLDLLVEAPGGGVVASSASSLNPFELVQFVPPATGTYTVKLVRQRFQGTSEPFALAWSTRQDAATNVVTVTGGTAIGQTAAIQWFDRYHPGATYVGVASLSTLPSTFPVSFNKILPLGIDPLTILSLSGVFPGFVGVLPANGTAGGQLPIPNDASLRGIVVSLAMVTLDLSLPELVEETSPATSFTIQ